MDRIDKIFSNLGLLSRSECKKAVKNGLIDVNGIPVKTSDQKVDTDKDKITYKGKEISCEKFVYYMLNKPAGVITATEDDSQKTVFDLIDDTRSDLAAVGRLDKDTTGILLITNDGKLNHNLLSPRHHVPKRYEVVIDGCLTEAAMAQIRSGIDIGDDKPTLPAELEILTLTSPQEIALTITEGRYHQVKRMMSAVGCPVLKLHRSRFGALELDSSLAAGEYRALKKEEIEQLTNINKE